MFFVFCAVEGYSLKSRATSDYLSNDEVDKLRDVADTTTLWVQALLRFFMKTGVRSSEAVFLKFSDIDPDTQS
jgi:integrase